MFVLIFPIIVTFIIFVDNVYDCAFDPPKYILTGN